MVLKNGNILQKRLGYAFKNPQLLEEAMTTPVYAKQHKVESYERLEYIGDAVVKLVMAQALYDEGIKDQEELTKQRNILESNKVLATRAVELGLAEHVVSLVPIHESDAGILSDVLEALCGAIYLDMGKDLDIVGRLVIAPILAKKNAIIDASPDQQKNQFLEAVQRIFRFTPAIKIDFDESGPGQAKRFKAKNLRVLHPADGCVVIEFPELATDGTFPSQKEAEKALMKMAFDEWKKKDFTA
nr:ribonuclease III domain-containing protein [Candidatus Sigynarchaeota archaeon]